MVLGGGLRAQVIVVWPLCVVWGTKIFLVVLYGNHGVPCKLWLRICGWFLVPRIYGYSSVCDIVVVQVYVDFIIWVVHGPNFVCVLLCGCYVWGGDCG